MYVCIYIYILEYVQLKIDLATCSFFSKKVYKKVGIRFDIIFQYIPKNSFIS